MLFYQVQKAPGMAMLLIAWSITEIIRYSYYLCALIGSIPYVLQWCRSDHRPLLDSNDEYSSHCRYTFFIVLYPIGVTVSMIMMEFTPV